MRQMKFWKIAFTMLVVTLFIASCRNDEHKPTFLTREQQETYARNISGTYPAECCVFYVNQDSKRGFDEQGNPIVYGGKEVIEDVQFHVYNYNMQHIAFGGFPVSIISRVIDGNEGLKQALETYTTPTYAFARYNFKYSNEGEIIWYFQPNGLDLTLNYEGADHLIRIILNNSQYHAFNEEQLLQSTASSVFKNEYHTLDLTAIYDGDKLIQRFDRNGENEMFFIYKTAM